MKILYILLTVLFVIAIVISLIYISNSTEFINQVFGYFIVIISINGIVFSYKRYFKKDKKK
ncbi:MAG: hypothetical protein RBQ97_10835 [Acholeplasma sp.]|jgi:hypothetical protein|nr:hypothetical protein [Acholeplasma sp.]